MLAIYPTLNYDPIWVVLKVDGVKRKTQRSRPMAKKKEVPDGAVAGAIGGAVIGGLVGTRRT